MRQTEMQTEQALRDLEKRLADEQVGSKIHFHCHEMKAC